VRICHLSWEYPPVVYGGLGRHVYAVATQQARAGHDVVVVSHVGIEAENLRQSTDVATPESVRASEELLEGVRVIRVLRDAPHVPFESETLMGWVAGLSSALTRASIAAAARESFDVVHAHDWMTAHSASIVSQLWGVPWIHTIHATEAGRHQGWLPGRLSEAIHSIEQWSVQSADQVLVCSQHMRWEVERLFAMPHAQVIPNGVDPAVSEVDSTLQAQFRKRFGAPLIVHTGRLEWEKGAHTLIEALPRIRRRFPNVHCVIAGRGSQIEALTALAKRKRVTSRVSFLGWLPEEELRALVAAADVAIVPSLYEPFGIVALEAASVGTPVVAARTGGLTEFLAEDLHGWGFVAGDAVDLAMAVSACLEDPGMAKQRAAAARSRISTHYGWKKIAQETVKQYQSCIRDSKPRTRKGDESIRRLATEGNLLFDVQ
jgi:glycogen(starch) synthase